MEERSLDKALDIYSALMTGREISRKNPDTRDLYEEFYSNGAVYDITTKLFKKLNLSLYEYKDAIYVSPGEGNRVFGYTNDDMKRILGLRLNKELYMVYFIMYNVLLCFYQDSSSYQTREYLKQEEIIEQVTTYLSAITEDLSVYSMNEMEEDSFKTLALLWDELPPATSEDKNRASRASRVGYVKLALNFMVSSKLFIEIDDRYYPTDRFHAIVENYFEEYKGKIYTVLGGEADA